MVRSGQTVDIPNIDLLTWTFGNQDYDQDKPVSPGPHLGNRQQQRLTSHFQLYIDGHDPFKTISRREARVYIRSMIAGLQAWGLEPGDSVCLHSFNNVRH